MKTEVCWNDRIPPRENFSNAIYCVCFRPDGSQILVAVGM